MSHLRNRNGYLNCVTLYVFLIFITASIVAPDSKAEGEKTNQVNWMAYASGMAQAKEQNKAVLLFFCADWCTTCIKMEKETFKDKSILAYLNANYISIKVKFDREQKIANKYRVRGLPTTVLIGTNRKESGPLLGPITADKLLGLLKKVSHPG